LIALQTTHVFAARKILVTNYIILEAPQKKTNYILLKYANSSIWTCFSPKCLFIFPNFNQIIQYRSNQHGPINISKMGNRMYRSYHQHISSIRASRVVMPTAYIKFLYYNIVSNKTISLLEQIIIIPIRVDFSWLYPIHTCY